MNAPIIDIASHTGKLYVSHRDKVSTANIANGTLKDLIVDLPRNANQYNNPIAFSRDGKRMFFGIGSATNSRIVGKDNFGFGWLANSPGLHDIQGKNITLTGQNFETTNPISAEPNDKATTGSFVPFNTTTKASQIVQGVMKYDSCIINANLDGTDVKMMGCGLRNPTELTFDDEDKLDVARYGADERGSRSIANDSDKFYEVKLNETAFYGLPDFFGNAQPVTDPQFKSPRAEGKPLEFLIQSHPPVKKPLMLFEPPHVAIIQMAFANKSFGFAGEAFVA